MKYEKPEITELELNDEIDDDEISINCEGCGCGT